METVGKKILINATQAEELRVAIVQDNILFDLDMQTTYLAEKKANVYRAKVSRIEQSLNAIFVDYGADRHGFLPMKELAPQYLDKDNRPNLREGQEIIIQIEKEERGTKGAAVTTVITLAGCYLVLMPNSHRAGGVSRRIEGEDRQQLKEILSQLTVPENMSVIARTACLGRTQEELQWDLNALLKLWETIQDESTKHPAPFLIYQESDVIMRSVRDYLRQDIEEILVDDRKTYERVLQYVKTLRPDFVDRVHYYNNELGIFTYHRIESQIETAFQREVKLPSGGSIVIDHTEALTSVDINSAKATKAGDIEETAFQTNLEASREIARQLKLRDLGGLIVIDYIDMESQKNQRLIEDELAGAVKGDRARIQFGKISRFGLLEMSRQRLRPSLEESSGLTCPRCNGQGTIRGVESLSLSIIRLIQEEAMRADILEVHVQLPLSVAIFMSNEKRHMIAGIESQNKVRVVLIPNPNIETPHYELTKVVKSSDETTPSYHLQAPVSAETFTPTSTKIREVEQPAIRELTISKAPTTKGGFKKTLSSLMHKIQEVFTPAPEEKASATPHQRGSGDRRRPSRNNGQQNNRNSSTREPREQRDMRESREPREQREPREAREGNRTAGPRQENGPRSEGGGRRNNNDRRRGNNRNGPRREGAPRISPEIAMPGVKSEKPTPILIDFSVTKTASPAPEPIQVSPKVQAILNQSSASTPISQVESTQPKQEQALKIVKEEVVQKTEFSIEAARETVKKQHEQQGVRVETAVPAEEPSAFQKYVKEVKVVQLAE